MKPVRSAAAMLLLAALPVEAAGSIPYTFRFTPQAGAERVSVVGSFNQWDPSANPMTLVDGQWVAKVELPPGEHAYKFLVNGSEYVTDPAAPGTADDGFGGKNGLVRFEAPLSTGSQAPAGVIEPSQLRHRPDMPDRDRKSERVVTLRFATRPGDLKSATLLVIRDGRWHASTMGRFATTPVGDYWRTSIDASQGPLRYLFWIEDKKGRHFYGMNGLSANPDAPFAWDWEAAPAFVTPSWAKGAVFYQIFPERFANGNRRNDPPGTQPWGGIPTNTNYFGGDLEGIRQHLDHLALLGVDALYLNPIFEADSNHKYNTTDYTRIDPAFGSNEDFRALADTLHSNGMRVMLDGVFNHTGTRFAAFQDATARGRESPAFGWYMFQGWPVRTDPKPNYAAWWGYASLPKLNVENPEVARYLLGIAQRWVGPGLADGWRLDVPNEVPRPFWTQFRTAVRRSRPDALIAGEIWGDGSPWLDGDAFDSVMNYRFRSAMLDFVAYEKTDAKAFGDALDQIRADYGDQVEGVLLNLLDSHDTPRFLYEAKGDKSKLKLAAFLQMTLPGMPMIYYGDEVGMSGGADPLNRKPMVWDPVRQDSDLLYEYQRYVTLRKSWSALRWGEIERLPSPQPRVFVFRRTYGTERLLVVANAGSDRFDLAPLLKHGRLVFPAPRSTALPPHTGAVIQELP